MEVGLVSAAGSAGSAALVLTVPPGAAGATGTDGFDAEGDPLAPAATPPPPPPPQAAKAKAALAVKANGSGGRFEGLDRVFGSRFGARVVPRVKAPGPEPTLTNRPASSTPCIRAPDQSRSNQRSFSGGEDYGAWGNKEFGFVTKKRAREPALSGPNHGLAVPFQMVMVSGVP